LIEHALPGVGYGVNSIYHQYSQLIASKAKSGRKQDLVPNMN
jgi:hypothetical protein